MPKSDAFANLSLETLITSTVEMLTPNSLQFNEQEFQRSPKEARDAAQEAVVVLDECTVLHIGLPVVRVMPLERLLLPQRQPVVLRVPMSETELQLFLRCARQLIGCEYDVAR
ncbi:hypothetical protein KXD40_005509 [Peronospora effusa]|nr:hypothetical protein KXD40_005509 [Peronospora effusa]